MPNPVAVVIELTEEERAQLQAWARRPSSAQALAQRSRILLLAAEGLKNTDVAQRLGISRKMATNWRAAICDRSP
jgi:DNA-binding NarL/FixJ family response regulator